MNSTGMTPLSLFQIEVKYASADVGISIWVESRSVAEVLTDCDMVCSDTGYDILLISLFERRHAYMWYIGVVDKESLLTLIVVRPCHSRTIVPLTTRCKLDNNRKALPLAKFFQGLRK